MDIGGREASYVWTFDSYEMIACSSVERGCCHKGYFAPSSTEDLLTQKQQRWDIFHCGFD